MAMRKREEQVLPNVAGVDVRASSHWVAVPAHSTAAPVREFGAITDDLTAMADRLLAWTSAGPRAPAARRALRSTFVSNWPIGQAPT